MDSNVHQIVQVAFGIFHRYHLEIFSVLGWFISYSSSPGGRAKFRLSTALKDFMQSDTYKLLMDKQNQSKDEDSDQQSKE